MTGKSSSAISAKRQIPMSRKCAGPGRLRERYGHYIPDLPNTIRFRQAAECGPSISMPRVTPIPGAEPLRCERKYQNPQRPLYSLREKDSQEPITKIEEAS